jgi:hypothetical protein
LCLGSSFLFLLYVAYTFLISKVYVSAGFLNYLNLQLMVEVRVFFSSKHAGELRVNYIKKEKGVNWLISKFCLLGLRAVYIMLLTNI